MKCLKYCTINKRCLRCETLYCTTNKGSKTMYVRGVKSGVCGFYTTVYTEYSYSCQRGQKWIGSFQYRVMLLVSKCQK